VYLNPYYILIWCREPDLNRHGYFYPLDFKSKVSANSTIPALFWAYFFSVIYQKTLFLSINGGR
jgi:hypothetical protein